MIFKPNIGTTGRVFRAAIAAVLTLLGFFLPDLHVAFRAAFIALGVFVGFEALRGWCALRACGIRTRL